MDNTYSLRYSTTKTMPWGVKYYFYPAAILKVIKSYITLHITTAEKGIIRHKPKMTIQTKLACNQIQELHGWVVRFRAKHGNPQIR